MYKNGTVIRKLIDRANAGSLKDKYQTENDLNALINNDDNAEIFNTPVSAFVTFQTEEAAARVAKYYYYMDDFTGKENPHYQRMTIDGIDMPITSAPEPSDIIYENFEISKS
jgi:hypothetical protein